MKPEFSKTFNLEHAKAGGPITLRDGTEATVLKWDGRHPVYPLTGVAGPDDYMTCWTNAGKYEETPHDHKSDLVMLPLGMIDGKPVFVGDELAVKGCGGAYIASSRDFKALHNLAWPAPAKVYPTFTGSVDALAITYGESNNFSAGLVRVADAALRHAIDDGQLVVASDRAARDMAIAKAVQYHAVNAGDGSYTSKEAAHAVTTTARKVSELDLAAIIATTK